MQLHSYTYHSPLGIIVLSSDSQHLTGVWFTENNQISSTTNDTTILTTRLPVFAQTIEWLDLYFTGHQPTEYPPLKPSGTSFQQLVWQQLLTIPYGSTCSYQTIANQIAKHLNKPFMSAQAIGQAIGKNPIQILIPCHRVIGSHGQLTGYAGGLARKAALLNIEKAIQPNNYKLFL